MKALMKYIFLKRDKNDDNDILSGAKIHEMFQKVFMKASDIDFEIDMGEKNYVLTYKIVHNPDQDMSYVNITAQFTESLAYKVLNEMHNRLIKGEHRKKYFIVLTHDSVSEYYCNKIFPLFGKFERLMRELILDILLKSLGVEGYKNTFSQNFKDYFKSRNIRNENKLIEDALYELDLNQLEEYLFTPIPEVDFGLLLDRELTVENMVILTKEEIQQLINKCRSRSLWDRFFINKEANIPQIDKSILDEIRQERNKIAHNKFFYKDKYVYCKAMLKSINKSLEAAIDKLVEKDFNEKDLEDVINATGKLLEFTNIENKPSFLVLNNLLTASIMPMLTSGLKSSQSQAYSDILAQIKQSSALNIAQDSIKAGIMLQSSIIKNANVDFKKSILKQSLALKMAQDSITAGTMLHTTAMKMVEDSLKPLKTDNNSIMAGIMLQSSAIKNRKNILDRALGLQIVHDSMKEKSMFQSPVIKMLENSLKSRIIEPSTGLKKAQDLMKAGAKLKSPTLKDGHI